MEKFDVVVAGAGTAGCLTAKTTAKTGLKTCLVDFKKREDIGKKICGDAIGKHHFDNLGLKTPTGDEVERVMEGVEIYSPDVQTSYVVKGEQLYGYILNRYQFGQRLVKEAQDNGAILYDSTQVLEPIINQGSIWGVTVKIYVPYPGTDLYNLCVDQKLYLPPASLEDWGRLSSWGDAGINVSNVPRDILESTRVEIEGEIKTKNLPYHLLYSIRRLYDGDFTSINVFKDLFRGIFGKKEEL